MEFINITDLSALNGREDILEAFYKYARLEKAKKIDSLVREENLKDSSRLYIDNSIKMGTIEHAGEELDKIIPPMSRREGLRIKKKETVFEKIRKLVEVFKGI